MEPLPPATTALKCAVALLAYPLYVLLAAIYASFCCDGGLLVFFPAFLSLRWSFFFACLLSFNATRVAANYIIEAEYMVSPSPWILLCCSILINASCLAGAWIVNHPFIQT